MHFLPKSTEFGKRIPKQTFYEKLSISPAIKKAFSEQIKTILWQNKLSSSTLKIDAGKFVTEIQVFEVQLSGQRLDEAVLELIDAKIPYHILFILSFNGKVQAWTGYKEAAEGDNKAFRVNKYYHTEWMPESGLNLEIEGLDMDAVWENLIIQIGGIKVGEGKSLGEQIRIDEQKAKLEKEIEKLEKQARNEKQPRKKFELVQKAKALKLGIRGLEVGSVKLGIRE